MDAVSLAIVVTVLSLGSALIYLFKSDHERRQLVNNNKTIQLIHNNNNLNHGKQRNLTTSEIQPAHHQSIKKSNNNSISKPVKTQPANNTVKQVPSSILLTDSIENTIPITQVTTKQPQSNANASSSAVESRVNNQNKGRKQQTSSSDNNSLDPKTSNEPKILEPSLDELDSSILLSVFKPPNAKLSNSNASKSSNKHNSYKSTSSNSTPPLERKAFPKKRRVSQDILNQINNNNNSSNSSYSSDQLFSLIAATNLSKEEVETAIETLLNKLETAADATWKQPKSDPLNRLKNQLKDSEAALSTEIQNHELNRARLQELKLQLQNEKSLANSNKEGIIKANKELGVVNIALEQARTELSKQQLLCKQLKDDTFQIISKHEQEKVQIQSLLSNALLKEPELRNQLEEKEAQLQRYELSNQALNEKLEDMGSKIDQLELQLDQVRSSKHHDDYEAGVKISELESDGMRRDKALKDQNAHLEELLEANTLLQKSVNELQIINGRQEEMLKRLRDERLINESSMKRTLCEMEQELKELQSKLSANNDEKLRKEMIQVERELSNVEQREQKLASQIKQLKEGLTDLLPDLKLGESINPSFESEDWVHQYLKAINQLAKIVNELRENLKITDNNNTLDSPSKKLVDKSTLTSNRNGAISPVSNGRSIKSYNYYDRDSDKKLVETKLLELTEYVEKLENNIKTLEDNKNVDKNLQKYENQVKELKLYKTKLEAQIKFGLDSLKAEQQRARALEEELSKFTVQITQTS